MGAVAFFVTPYAARLYVNLCKTRAAEKTFRFGIAFAGANLTVLQGKISAVIY